MDTEGTNNQQKTNGSVAVSPDKNQIAVIKA